MAARYDRAGPQLQENRTAASSLEPEENSVPFLQALADSGGKEFVAVDPAGQVMCATPKFRSLLGPDGSGREDGQALADYMRRVRRADGELAEKQFRLTMPVSGRPNGVEMKAHARPVRHEAGKLAGYLVVARPASMHCSPGDEDTLARQEKLVALGTIAAGIAHEIGNPLASLSAVVQLLKRKVSSGEISDHLDTLHEQIQRIARIVRQMLSFSRPSSQERTPTDVNELIEQTVTLVGYSQKGRELDIRVDGGDRLPEMRIMPQLFQQVLVNLLLNAADAVEDEEEGVIRVTRQVQENWLCIGVEDNGRGMTEEEKERALDPFYTTKPADEGTGLGLAVSYRLIQREGGDICINTSPGEGTRMTVYLPRKLSCEDG